MQLGSWPQLEDSGTLTIVELVDAFPDLGTFSPRAAVVCVWVPSGHESTRSFPGADEELVAALLESNDGVLTSG